VGRLLEPHRSLHELASFLHEDGRLDEAKDSWEQSLAILEEVGDHRVEQVRRRMADLGTPGD
jgi:hypothetical protein